MIWDSHLKTLRIFCHYQHNCMCFLSLKMNHTTEKHILKSMGDSSLNVYILGNAISKAIWFPSTMNTVRLQRKKEKRKKEIIFCCLISHPSLWSETILSVHLFLLSHGLGN